MKGLRKWPWGALPVYNGFTHEERVRGWQLVMFLIDNRLMAKPTVCCISGRTDRVQLHSESYYHWHPHALTQSIHLALHQRFRSPDRWRAIVAQYAVTGDEWFARLSLTPVDLAGQLRAKYGLQITDVFGTASQSYGVHIPR
ncbi:hypothetical protein [Mesorhizobium sp. KR1-2]|uniref:hypothetical protein n=1 Tax=Mesorhizobium sp. KR1-2 TaxID=3156609 RepID=UPI0032B48CFB